MQPSLLAAPSNIQGNLDVIKMASDLNCHRFDSNCHWSNADEDELDWNVLLSTPEVEPLVSALETTNIPGERMISSSQTGYQSIFHSF